MPKLVHITILKPTGFRGIGTVDYIRAVVSMAPDGASRPEQRSRSRILKALDQAVEQKKEALILESEAHDHLKDYMNKAVIQIIAPDLADIQDAIEQATVEEVG